MIVTTSEFLSMEWNVKEGQLKTKFVRKKSEKIKLQVRNEMDV